MDNLLYVSVSQIEGCEHVADVAPSKADGIMQAGRQATLEGGGEGGGGARCLTQSSPGEPGAHRNFAVLVSGRGSDGSLGGLLGWREVLLMQGAGHPISRPASIMSRT